MTSEVSTSGQAGQVPADMTPPSKHARYVKQCMVDGVECVLWSTRRGLVAVPIVEQATNNKSTNEGLSNDRMRMYAECNTVANRRAGRGGARMAGAGNQRQAAAARLKHAVWWLLAVMGILGALLGCGH